MASKWVPIPEFIRALDITIAQFRVMVEGGYVHIAPHHNSQRTDWSTWKVLALDPVPITNVTSRQVYNMASRIKQARRRYPISRRRIMMWLMNLELGDCTRQLPFDKTLELEVRRIAKLREPMRTEQALRLLLRFRDADEILRGLSQVRGIEASAKELARLASLAAMRSAKQREGRARILPETRQARKLYRQTMAECPPAYEPPPVYRIQPPPATRLQVPQFFLPGAAPSASRNRSQRESRQQ